jgi:hypothetical protein
MEKNGYDCLGQSKMVKRPVIMHIIVYVGFIIINIEFGDYN